MKNLFKFLFFITYILLVINFYKTTFKPGLSKFSKYWNDDTTAVIKPPLNVKPPIIIIPKDTLIVKLPKSDTSKVKVDFTKSEYLDKLFTNGSSQYENSKIDDNAYIEYASTLKSFLMNKFSIKQLKDVQYIHLINWEDLNNNVGGLTSGYNDNLNNTIYLPIKNDSYKESLLHEIWHSIHFANYSYFNKTYGTEWNSIPECVSDYAMTTISEDVAETGRLYSSGSIGNNNKFKIIDKFYKYTY